MSAIEPFVTAQERELEGVAAVVRGARWGDWLGGVQRVTAAFGSPLPFLPVCPALDEFVDAAATLAVAHLLGGGEGAVQTILNLTVTNLFAQSQTLQTDVTAAQAALTAAEDRLGAVREQGGDLQAATTDRATALGAALDALTRQEAALATRGTLELGAYGLAKTRMGDAVATLCALEGDQAARVRAAWDQLQLTRGLLERINATAATVQAADANLCAMLQAMQADPSLPGFLKFRREALASALEAARRTSGSVSTAQSAEFQELASNLAAACREADAILDTLAIPERTLAAFLLDPVVEQAYQELCGALSQRVGGFPLVTEADLDGVLAGLGDALAGRSPDFTRIRETLTVLAGSAAATALATGQFHVPTDAVGNGLVQVLKRAGLDRAVTELAGGNPLVLGVLELGSASVLGGAVTCLQEVLPTLEVNLGRGVAPVLAEVRGRLRARLRGAHERLCARGRLVEHLQVRVKGLQALLTRFQQLEDQLQRLGQGLCPTATGKRAAESSLTTAPP